MVSKSQEDFCHNKDLFFASMDVDKSIKASSCDALLSSFVSRSLNAFRFALMIHYNRSHQAALQKFLKHKPQ